MPERIGTPKKRSLARITRAASAPFRFAARLPRLLWRATKAGASFAGDQIPDVLLLAGAAAMTYGVWQIHHPAGWIAGGALALAAGWRLGRPMPEVKRG